MRAIPRRQISLATKLGRLASPGLVTLAAIGMPLAGNAEPALPPHVSPSGATSADIGSGRVVAGTYALAASQDALRDVLARVHGYFDAEPALLSAVRSKDGRVTIAAFDAKLAKQPVRGLLITMTQPGTAREAWLFDRPGRLAASLPRMEARLSSMQHNSRESENPPARDAADLKTRWIAAAETARGIALTRTDFPDGTGAIGIASGFTPSQMQTAGMIARSADGAALRIQGVIGAIDPHGNAMFRGGGIAVAAYSPDVATAWENARRAFRLANNLPDEQLTVESSTSLETGNGKKGAVVYGYAMQSGKRVAYQAIVTVSPPAGSYASWTLVFTALWAPVDRFAQDAPALVAMMSSYTADMTKANQIQTRTVDEILARSAAQTQSMLDSNAAWRERQARNSAIALQQSAVAQDYIQREGASAIHIIKGEDQVYSGQGSSRHSTVSLEASGNFVSVPISSYIKGVDY